MKFFKEHRFTFVITLLIILLIIVSFYMLWVHVPYANHQNKLDDIKNEIIKENDYQYEGYFNDYNSKSIYYVLKVSKDKKVEYVIHNKDGKFIDSYAGDIVKEEIVKNSFKDEYKVDATRIEIGYENDSFVYCVTYKGKDSLIYAFYRLGDGEFLKAYRL